MNACARCGHDEKKDHCKSGIRHPHYKDEMRMAHNPRVTVCKTRHCLQPMCSCTNFVPGETK